MVQEDMAQDKAKRGDMRRTATAEASLPAELELDRALDRKQTGALTGLAEITLAKMAQRGEGPPYFKVGRNVRYRLRDVQAWIEARTVA